jgi:hypothetical protein
MLNIDLDFFIQDCESRDPNPLEIFADPEHGFPVKQTGRKSDQKQCCGSGSGIRDPGSGAFLTPGSGIRNRFFPDPGSRISDPGSQDHIFKSFDNFLGKKVLYIFENWPKFFSSALQN